MVRRRVLLAVLLLAAAGLAGCVAEDGVEGPGDDTPNVVRDPKDYSYLENESMANGSHIHDYWNGQDQVDVLDKIGGCLGSCTTTGGGQNGITLAALRPDADDIVPGGAAWVHVVANWSIAEGSYDGIALFVKTANMSKAVFVSLLEPGVSVTMDLTQDDADPPHHRLSLWRFEVRALPPEGESSAQATDYEVHVKAVAERGLEIPVYPPHPDLWNGTDRLELYAGNHSVLFEYGIGSSHSCSGCHPTLRPDNGTIVPYDASHVEVVVEVEQGMPQMLELWFHGADTWDYAAAPIREDEPLRVVWRIDVEGRPDSPYAKQSLWEFRMVNGQETPVKAWSATYDVSVTVHK